MAESLVSTPEETSAIPSNAWLVLDVLAVYVVAASVAWLVRSAEWFFLRNPQSWLAILTIEGSFLLSSVWLLRRHSLSLYEIGFRRPIRPFVWVGNGLLAPILALIAMWSALHFHIPGLPRDDSPTIFSDMLWIGLFAPISEEILIRGWFQTALSKRNPGKERKVILISALLFAALHVFYSLRGAEMRTVLWWVLFTFFLGLITATLKEKCQSLIPPIFTHALYNICGIFLSRAVAFIIEHPHL